MACGHIAGIECSECLDGKYAGRVPLNILPGNISYVPPILTLRDEFAKAALQGLSSKLGWCADYFVKEETNKEGFMPGPELAKACYAYADAMLAERNREKKPKEV